MRGAKRLEWTLVLVVAGAIASAPALAGSRVVGTLAGGLNVTVEGLSPAPTATIFAGQHLRVGDGAAIVATGAGARMVFGRETDAWFSTAQDAVAVQLERGDVSMYVPSGTNLRVNVGSISVAPASGFPTLCSVAMNGDLIGIASKKGSVRVEGQGAPLEVPQGKAISIRLRTAASPQGAPASSGGGSSVGRGGPSALTVGALAAGVTGAVVGFVGISKANTAENDASTAQGAANAASSAAATASSAAATASEAAATATAAAAAAAALSETLANNIGCLLNVLAGEVNKPSPYTPPSGQSCH